MIRIYSIALLLVWTLAALPAAAAPQASAVPRPEPTTAGLPNPDFMGMVIRDPWYDFNTNPAFPGQPNQAFQDTMGAMLEHIGVRWVRLDIHIEVPLADVTADQTQAIDAEIEKNAYFIETVAPQHNLKVLALLSFDLLQGTDMHVLNSGPFNEPSIFGGGVNKYMHAWLTRALQIADRYRDNIAGYEVLNEENRLPPGGDAIEPSITGRLLTKFYRFCKNIDPAGEGHGCSADTKIILGGIHPRGTLNAKPPNLNDAEYLRAIYNDQSSFGDFKAAHGFYPVDGIGYHPYPQEIRLSPNDAMVDKGIARMRAVLNEVVNGTPRDPEKQFWITEVGYNVGFDLDGPNHSIPAQTEAGQVAFMRDVYTSLAQRQLANGQPEIANVFWFKYEDFPPASGPNAQHWGVVRIPFTTGNCPGGACYELNGTPSQLRGSFLAYRELAGIPSNRILAPLIVR
jgi:hypothetical protein